MWGGFDTRTGGRAPRGRLDKGHAGQVVAQGISPVPAKGGSRGAPVCSNHQR